MISINDTTILAVLSRFPDMPSDEADEYISKIEHEENVPICKAILGRISKDELSEEARETFDGLANWSENRTTRFRDEQLTSRRRRRETRTALALNKMRERGLISDQMMVIYGISGPLPDQQTYANLSLEEKQRIWTERMESRYGPEWRGLFGNAILPVVRKSFAQPAIDWRVYGF